MKVACQGCGEDFEAKRKTAKYCGDSCRKRGLRKGKPTEDDAADTLASMFKFVAETERELERIKKLDTVKGQQVLLIAVRMTSPFETGSAVASLSKEHSRLMSELGRGAEQVDPVQAAKDEVARKRAERHAS